MDLCYVAYVDSLYVRLSDFSDTIDALILYKI